MVRINSNKDFHYTPNFYPEHPAELTLADYNARHCLSCRKNDDEDLFVMEVNTV